MHVSAKLNYTVPASQNLLSVTAKHLTEDLDACV